MPSYVAVIGPGDGATEDECAHARAAAATLASRGVVIVTGGLGGVMGAAAEGAASVGGASIGLLPGRDRERAHPALTYAIPTGLGELRNGLVVRSADCVLAVGGSWGTLSELALAVRTGTPVVALHGWELDRDGPETAVDVADAVSRVLAHLRVPVTAPTPGSV